VAKPPEKFEVDIIEERAVTLPGLEGKPAEEVWVTYRYARMPPRMIRIPKEKYTEKERNLRIHEDIKAALEAKKPKVTV